MAGLVVCGCCVPRCYVRLGGEVFWHGRKLLGRCVLLSRRFLPWWFMCCGWFGFLGLCAGIRVKLACFMRRPCAGRHLLFFAAAKKSRQKKAAHTANS